MPTTGYRTRFRGEFLQNQIPVFYQPVRSAEAGATRAGFRFDHGAGMGTGATALDRNSGSHRVALSPGLVHRHQVTREKIECGETQIVEKETFPVKDRLRACPL